MDSKNRFFFRPEKEMGFEPPVPRGKRGTTTPQVKGDNQTPSKGEKHKTPEGASPPSKPLLEEFPMLELLAPAGSPEAVTAAVESACGVKVAAVNVNVCGIARQ